MTFWECLRLAASSPEFVANYDRLRGTQLSKMGLRSALDRLIDEATGHEDAQLRLFVGDVWDLIWCRLPEDARMIVDVDLKCPTCKTTPVNPGAVINEKAAEALVQCERCGKWAPVRSWLTNVREAGASTVRRITEG